jgi:hypothetical protein
VLVAAGCYSPLGELVASHVEAGGAVAASLDAGPSLSTKALADATGDPMTINGTSPAFVFGLIVGDDDGSAMAGKARLVANMPVTMTVTATSRAQVSVHLDGKSCAATSAVVHLTPDGKGHIDGDFVGSGNGCQFSGTLSQVPIEQ